MLYTPYLDLTRGCLLRYSLQAKVLRLDVVLSVGVVRFLYFSRFLLCIQNIVFYYRDECCRRFRLRGIRESGSRFILLIHCANKHSRHHVDTLFLPCHSDSMPLCIHRFLLKGYLEQLSYRT